MVHTKRLLPVISPVTPLVADEGVVTVALPKEVQVPLPGAGLLPASVAVVAAHNDWSGPALAVTTAVTVIKTVSRATHGPLVTVQIKV
jgi:hypothetical protein